MVTIDMINEKEKQISDIRSEKTKRPGTKQEYISLISGLQEELNILRSEYDKEQNENTTTISPLPKITWDQIRKTRNGLLLSCDWRVLTDVPISETKRNQWKQYRQKLRDIPQTYSFPEDVVWPDPSGNYE